MYQVYQENRLRHRQCLLLCLRRKSRGGTGLRPSSDCGRHSTRTGSRAGRLLRSENLKPRVDMRGRSEVMYSVSTSIDCSSTVLPYTCGLAQTYMWVHNKRPACAFHRPGACVTGPRARRCARRWRPSPEAHSLKRLHPISCTRPAALLRSSYEARSMCSLLGAG